MLHSKFETKMNAIWEEGERATRDNDFDEKAIDADFNIACDSCLVEIEFVMFQCLGCRSFTICEECFEGAQHDETGEHSKKSH